MFASSTPRTALALSLLAAAVVLSAAAPGAFAELPASVDTGAPVPHEVSGLAGKVSAPAAPLASARVYVYRLSDLKLQKSVTDDRGHFQFDDLPAGLYKVIAHKPGFLPAVVRLTRATAEAYQFLELELAEAPPQAAGDDFWSLREQVPTDVLRDIQVAEIADSARQAGTLAPLRAARLLTDVHAMTGVDDIAGGEGQVTQGGVGIEGRLGDLRLGLSGDYWQLQPSLSNGGPAVGTTGEASTVSLSVVGNRDMSVNLSSRSNRLVTSEESAAPVDFENYRLAVSHAVGQRGHSEIVAQYTSENNFHRHGWVDPQAIPEASRSWRLEGTYTAELSDRASLQTGIRYRQRELAFGLDDGNALVPQQERVDLFGRAGMQVQPSVLVEYGLYTTLRDGSVSLSPRGGVVVQLSKSWQAAAEASYKVHDEEPPGLPDYFSPAAIGPIEAGETCDRNEAQCYQVTLTHRKSDDEVLTIGATHRQFDETQRLYFSNDLVDRYDSLYLVPGDRLPEVEVMVSRRLSPKVLTKLQSSIAEGGGGVFFATDQGAYENNVRYMVTSLDTHFDATSTGLFVAFHYLEQELQSLDPQGEPTQQLEVERLELALTQDLNFLVGMATDMALQLNMQVSRGSWPFLSAASQDEREELRKRLLGGIAFRF
jgi:hypothetical protein